MLAIATAVATSTAVPATSPACMPLEHGDGGSPVITALVNDAGPFAFVLDTGSSGTTLDDRRTKQLQLVPDGSAEQAHGMGGAIDVRLFRLSRFEAGPVTVRDLIVPGIAAPSLASHDIAGLAGVDLFGRRLVTWRWDRSCVQLGQSGSKPLGSGWKTIGSRWLKPWKVLIPVRIGTARGWGLLDTGAQKSILSPGFARVAGLGEAAGSEVEGITGIDGKETPLAAYRISAVVGLWSYSEVKVSVAALPLFDRLGGMDQPVAVIGMDWIGSNQFAIDYGAERVWQKASVRKAKR
ncbi:aspartyl protease family protein [Sphingomonas arantia]|uniref:Aspartyl protease family protein n=1 Tax=Sphingomonas arantia TaxID=1460676 RepID=A0ABW4U231_9SPHN